MGGEGEEGEGVGERWGEEEDLVRAGRCVSEMIIHGWDE